MLRATSSDAPRRSHLLAPEPALEDVEVIAQARKREQRLVDLGDLRRDAAAQPVARGAASVARLPRTVERVAAERGDELVAAAGARHAIDQDLALAPRVGGQLERGPIGARLVDEHGVEQALGLGAVAERGPGLERRVNVARRARRGGRGPRRRRDARARGVRAATARRATRSRDSASSCSSLFARASASGSAASGIAPSRASSVAVRSR